MRARPVRARAAFNAIITASVPLLQKRTRSTDAMRSQSSSIARRSADAPTSSPRAASRR